MRELVNEDDVRCASDHRVDVELTELVPREDVQTADLRFGGGAPVGLDEPDDDVGSAALSAPPALVQHRVGLADTGCCTEIDAEAATRHCGKRTVRAACRSD